MKHTVSRRFWQCLDALPVEVQALSRKSYAQLRADASHPSLHFKAIGKDRFYSVRIGLSYRALGVPVTEGVPWFWIGTHGEYARIIG